MKTKIVFGLVLSFLVLVIFGCGGGGDGGGGGATTTPALLTITQSTTTANTNNNNTISTNVTITAHATVNGVAVPDGTPVAFTIKSGVGTLSAPSVATVNGAASVVLTSATDGASVVVTASNGGVSADSATITFTDPNRLTEIFVTATPTTGLIPGTVIISAKPMRVGGNGVIAGPMPDGFPVSFSVTSGTGTLSAASAPTTGGVATVNLTGTAANTSVTVMAVAGSVSSDVIVPFIAQPTTATVKVRTSGPLPANGSIAILDATITYAINKGLSITNVAFTGAAAGATGFNTPNVSTPGQVVITTDLLATITVLGVIEQALLNNRAGIPEGEFATLTFSIAPGNVPTLSDFGIANFLVADDGGTPIPGMSVTIMSLTLQ